jgi:hypothetical protein
VWTNVSMTLRGKDGDDRVLLRDVWGEVPAGETAAVIGTSAP